MSLITEIPQTVMDEYNVKFRVFDSIGEGNKADATKKGVIMKHDPTLFAYYHFRDKLGQPFKLYSVQDMIVNCKDKNQVVILSRQSGKTTALMVKAFHYVYWHNSSTVLVISKTKEQSMEMINKLRELLRSSSTNFDELLTGPDNKRELYVKNPYSRTQSRIVSVPATDAARGYAADMVIADEIAFWDNGEEMFNQAISPTVAQTKGTILMASTPRGNIGPLFNAYKDPKNWQVFHFDWRVCPFYTQEEMDMKRKMMSEYEFRQEYEASFMANQAAYFREAEIRDAVKDYVLFDSAVSPVVIGVDFGKMNDNTIICIGTIENPNDNPDYHRIKVLNLIEKPLGTTYNTIVGELKAILSRYNVMKILYDATGVGEGPGDFMKDLGLPVEPIKFSIQSKINFYSNLKLMFERRQIVIPRNKKLIDQLLLFEYEYTTGGNMKLHHPDGGFDDYNDALALMVYGLKRPGSVMVTLNTIRMDMFKELYGDKDKVVDNRTFHYENKLSVQDGEIKQEMIKIYD